MFVLNLTQVLKQQFIIKHMKTLRQYKNRQNYFFNTMINIKNIDQHLLSINRMPFTSTDCIIYDIFFKNLDAVNSLYLVFNNVDPYIEEYNEDKYLIFALTGKNKEPLENYTEL